MTIAWPGAGGGGLTEAAVLAAVGAHWWPALTAAAISAYDDTGACLISLGGSIVCALDETSSMSASGIAITVYPWGVAADGALVSPNFVISISDGWMGGIPTAGGNNAASLWVRRMGRNDYTITPVLDGGTYRATLTLAARQVVTMPGATEITFSDEGAWFFTGIPGVTYRVEVIVVQGAGGGHALTFAQTTPVLDLTGFGGLAASAEGTADHLIFDVRKTAAGALRVVRLATAASNFPYQQ